MVRTSDSPPIVLRNEINSLASDSFALHIASRFPFFKAMVGVFQKLWLLSVIEATLVSSWKVSVENFSYCI
jgi:hypothetical protein